jgi:hypothetical protein
MSTPNPPSDPYGQPQQQPGQPEQPAQPQYGQYAPQDPSGAPQPGGYPQYGQQGQPADQPYGQQPYGQQPYGQAPAYPAYQGQPYGGPVYGYPKNSLAIWSLVLGIAAFVLSCGFLTGIPAVIVGNNAKKAVARGEANNGGMATAGIVLGWVSIVLGVLSLVWLFGFGGLAWYMDTLDLSGS